MFTDRVRLKLIAGSGGNGIVAWRREKYLPKGGPYGGNGGRGGAIVLKSDTDTYSLESFRNRRKISADNGQPGGTNRCQGRSGKDLVLRVPCGTLVKDGQTGEILHDFGSTASKWEICSGGRGGLGNACFKTSLNRAPNTCTPGKPGEERDLELELKLIADVGLVGMPNAGKSTLMSAITHTPVKIGAYPFTTLRPNLSFVQRDDYTRILIADIPGIIRGASQNKGLGLSFLRHIERTSTLVYVIDISAIEERDPFEDFLALREELENYSSEMVEKPFFVVLNKTDAEGAGIQLEAFKEKYPFPANTLLEVSALEKKGISSLIQALSRATQPPQRPLFDRSRIEQQILLHQTT
ncbi:MAG: GTPase Obg [Chlamydiae bacterium]|nr:GTPase Obg [Chlamydiota bacterium]